MTDEIRNPNEVDPVTPIDRLYSDWSDPEPTPEQEKKMKDRIHNFHPDTDTSTIADQLGVDEDEVIAAIHDTPEVVSLHDTIDAWLNTNDFTPAGEVKTGKWADQFIEYPSPYSDFEFFEIRERDPERRKYFLTDDAIIVRKLVDGSFFDLEYKKDAEIANLIETLRK